MRRPLIFFLTGLAILAILAASLFLALRYLALGRFLPPTTEEFALLAKGYNPIVQAIYDYKAEHGAWPEELDDLIPGYVTSLPTGRNLDWIPDPVLKLGVHADAPHTVICYNFLPGYEGWSVNGDFAKNGAFANDVSLPMPKLASIHPALTPEALARSRLAQLDRRITAVPLDHQNHARKIAYLLTLGRTADALAASKTAAATLPNWWRAQMALPTLATPQTRSAAETSFKNWVTRHPAFVHYCYLARYYRDTSRPSEALVALRLAIKYLADKVDSDPTQSLDETLFDAARFAYQQKDYNLVLELTHLWSLSQSTTGQDWLALQAAAELALGRFDAAKTDADRAIEQAKDHLPLAQHLDQLQHAATARNRAFQYDPGDAASNWQLFPTPQ